MNNNKSITLRSKQRNSDFHNEQKQGCPGCPMQTLGLCGIFIKGADGASSDHTALSQIERSTAARRLILRSNERINSVPVVCRGWAASAEYLRNGQRQILSFVLPGDLISASLLFREAPRHNVEAVTRVYYRDFDRMALREAMRARPDILELFLTSFSDETERIAEMVVDLGRRSAHQRVARLLLTLMERLEKSEMVRDQAFNFPLRQTHIADALGLTTPYVNQVLNVFREKRLISFEKRSLTILNAEELRGMIN